MATTETHDFREAIAFSCCVMQREFDMRRLAHIRKLRQALVAKEGIGESREFYVLTQTRGALHVAMKEGRASRAFKELLNVSPLADI